MASPDKKTALFLLYSCAFLALFCTAIWDSYVLTSSYFTENKMMSVSRSYANGKFPYLSSAKLCLMYKPDYVFPIKLTDRQQYVTMMIDSWRGHQSDVDRLNMSSYEKSIARSLLNLYLPTYLMNTIDEQGSDFLDTIVEYSDNHIDRSELATIVDQFLMDPWNIDWIRGNWSTIQPVFVRTTEPALDRDITIAKAGYLDRICVDIPLSDHMTTDSDRIEYFVDFLPILAAESNRSSNDHTDPHSHRRISSIYILFEGGDEVDLLPSPSTGDRSHNRISISNDGMYDSSKFPSCNKMIRSRSECFARIRTETYEEICNCTPFTMDMAKRLLQRSLQASNFTASHDDGSIPSYCTTKHYERCRSEVERLLVERNASANESRRCVPCLYSKNSYAVYPFVNPITSPWGRQDRFYSESWMPRASIRFECPERTYLLFEERPQFTFAQYLSQIGGDFGLYVGFSMMSVLNFMLFVYRGCRRRRRKPTNGEERTSIFRMLMAEVDRKSSVAGIDDVEKHGNTNELLKRIERLELRITRMDRGGEV